MGIVIRQSIFTTIISYAGVVLGYINLLYLYPKFLEPDQIGLLRVVQDTGILFAAFAQIGLSQTIVRFHPQLGKSRETSQEFLNLVLLLSLAGFSIFTIIFFAVKNQLISFFGDSGHVLQHYLILILWLTFILVFTTLIESYARVHLKISIPTFLREIGIRLFQSVLVVLYFFQVFKFETFILLSVVIYLISLATLIVYLFWTGEFHFRFKTLSLSKEKIKEIILYGLLSVLGTGAVLAIGKLDSLMITGILHDGLVQNAIYTTAFYMATVIEIPRRALGQASTTLISKAFEKNDLTEVRLIYSKTTINQLAVGCLLFLGIWANLDSIFMLMPKGETYEHGLYVVIIIGLTKIVDMAFGPNGEVLIMSRYYWFHTVSLLFMIVITVILNSILIPTWGIDGAAGATIITFIIFNLIKGVFIYKKLRIQPFSLASLKILLIAAVTASVHLLLPVIKPTLIDMIYRSIIISCCYGTLILWLKPSDEINKLVNQFVKKFI